MENILLPIDVNETFTVPEFACWLATITKSRLTGVILENIKQPSTPVLKTIHGMPYLETIVSEDFPENLDKKRKQSAYTRLFEEACERRGVKSTIHRDSGLPLEELIHESRFADLLIAEPEFRIESSDERLPSHCIESLLEKAECPVILSPASFEGIDEIVFAYDGTASSVFAIKQFTYLLPELSEKRMIVMQAAKEESQTITERTRIEELLRPHYSSVKFSTVDGDPDGALFEYLLGKKNAFLVMGAYGRTIISRFFHRSMASRLISTLNIPVFITHR